MNRSSVTNVEAMFHNPRLIIRAKKPISPEGLVNIRHQFELAYVGGQAKAMIFEGDELDVFQLVDDRYVRIDASPPPAPDEICVPPSIDYPREDFSVAPFPVDPPPPAPSILRRLARLIGR